MDPIEETHGCLQFFRKDGQLGTAFQLYSGKITIGCSIDADIRFKIMDHRLEEIHCVIEVTDDGIATLLNKSISCPINVNTMPIRKSKILEDDDEIELIGKKFLYLNSNASKKNIEDHQNVLKKGRSTSSKTRHSVAPLINLRSAKEISNFSTSPEMIYKKKSHKRSISNVSKTTSKVIVSKALGSPRSAKKRRLSFSYEPKKVARLSAREMLFSEIISPMTRDKSALLRPSVSMKKLDKLRRASDGRQHHLTSNDFTSEESLTLNLSSSSSVSPIMSSPGKCLTPFRKSLRKTQLQEMRVSKSPRNSLLKQCLQKNQNDSFTVIRKSLRKSINEDQTANEEQPSESPISNKSVRHSLRKSKVMEKEEHPETQFISEESEEGSVRKSKITEKEEESLSEESVFLNTSSRKSRLSAKGASVVQNREEQSSSEDSSFTLQSQTPSKPLTPLRQSLRRSIIMKNEGLLPISVSRTSNQTSRKTRQSLPMEESLTGSESMNWTSESEEDQQTLERALNEDGLGASRTRPLVSFRKSKTVEAKEGKGYDTDKEKQGGNQSLTTPEPKESPKTELSVSLTNLNTGNETFEKRRSSIRRSMKANNEYPGNTPLNASMKTQEHDLSKDRSSVRKSNRLNKSEVLELPNEDSLVPSAPAMSTPKDVSIHRRPTWSRKADSPIRRSLNLNKEEQNDDLRLSNDSSVNYPHEQSIQRKSTTTVRRGTRFSRIEDNDDLSVTEKFSDGYISHLNTPKSTSIREQQSTCKEASSYQKRESSVRKINDYEKDVSLGEDAETSTMNKSKETSMTQTPMYTPKERGSLMKNINGSTRGGNVELLSSSEDSVHLNVSSENSPLGMSIRRYVTPKKSVSLVGTPQERRSSVRKSRKANIEEEIGRPSSASSAVTPEVTSTGRWSMTTKQTGSSLRAPEERGSSARKNSRLSKEIKALFSSEESLENYMKTAEETSGYRRSKIRSQKFVSSDGTPKERGSSMRESKKLNRKTIELSSSEENSKRTSEEIPTSMQTPSERQVDDLSSNNEFEDLNVSPTIMKKETSIQRSSMTIKKSGYSLRTPKERRSSVRRNSCCNRSKEVEELSSSEESLVLVEDCAEALEGSSGDRRSKTHKKFVSSDKLPKERHCSLRDSKKLNKKTIELSSSEEPPKKATPQKKQEDDGLSSNEEIEDLNVSADNTPSEKLIQRRSMPEKSIDINKVQTRSRHSSISYMPNSKISTRRSNLSNETFDQSFYSSEDESQLSAESAHDRITPKHSSLRRNQSEEEASITDLLSNKPSRTKTPAARGSTASKSHETNTKQSISVITVNDSIDCTPENNTSIVIIDTPLDLTQFSRKKLSKTLNSTFQDDVELTTPKSAIKNRRSKSLSYKPITEDITPVSPLSKSKNESGFKTPLNTPGLFEEIKKSVLRSRSQIQKSSSNLTDEFDKVEQRTKAVKRVRDSSGSSARSNKKAKMDEQLYGTFDTADESDDSSFGTFTTGDVDIDISEQNVTHVTPKHFNDLTDKPFINHPQIRSMTEPKRKKTTSSRRSLQSTRLESQLSSVDCISKNDEILISETDCSSEQNDSVFESSTAISSRRSSRSSLRSQTNQQRDAPKRLQKSPKNDLSDVAGLKKLLKTPRKIESPKNDLTNVPNLRRLMSPKPVKSPKNDLRNVPNLRRIMSPKQQNSPKNDLSDVHGLKKLLRTPRERKEPQNDLRDVEGVANIFNMSGVQRLSMESDIENNEDLFEKLFARKPIKTYGRGKSLSPTSRKCKIINDKRKTVYDVPYTNPRVEKWIEEHAINKLKHSENESVGESFQETREPPALDEVTKNDGKQVAQESHKRMTSRKKKMVNDEAPIDEEKKDSYKRPIRSRRNLKQTTETEIATERKEESFKMTPSHEIVHTTDEEIKSPKKTTRRVKALMKNNEKVQIEQTSLVQEDQHYEVNTSTNDEVSTSDKSECKLPPVKRGRARNMLRKEESEQVSEVHSTTDDIRSAPKRGKGRRGAKEDKDTEVVVPSPRRVGKGKNEIQEEIQGRNQREQEELPQPRVGRERRKLPLKTDEETSNALYDSKPVAREETRLKRGRGRKIVITDEEIIETSDAVSENTVISINTRSRKRNKIALDTNSDHTTEEDISEVKEGGKTRKRVGRVQKKVAEKEIECEDEKKETEPVKITRSRRQVIKKVVHEDNEEREDNSGVVKKVAKTKRFVEEKNDVEEKKTTPVKSTRARRQPKPTDTSEEHEESPAVKVIKKKRGKIVEEPVPVDSPRTRERKGNFNKYGSDFLTEATKKDKGEGNKEKKQVHFETKSPTIGVLGKKRKGRKTSDVEVEDTVRRSKRTRK